MCADFFTRPPLREGRSPKILIYSRYKAFFYKLQIEAPLRKAGEEKVPI